MCVILHSNDLMHMLKHHMVDYVLSLVIVITNAVVHGVNHAALWPECKDDKKKLRKLTYSELESCAVISSLYGIVTSKSATEYPTREWMITTVMAPTQMNISDSGQMLPKSTLLSILEDMVKLRAWLLQYRLFVCLALL